MYRPSCSMSRYKTLLNRCQDRINVQISINSVENAKQLRDLMSIAACCTGQTQGFCKFFCFVICGSRRPSVEHLYCIHIMYFLRLRPCHIAGMGEPQSKPRQYFLRKSTMDSGVQGFGGNSVVPKTTMSPNVVVISTPGIIKTPGKRKPTRLLL